MMKRVELLSRDDDRMLTDDEYVDPSDGMIYCRKCGQPKQYSLNPETLCFRGPILVRTLCACEQAERDEKEQMEIKEQRKSGIAKLRARAFSNEQFQNCTFDNSQYNSDEMRRAQRYVEVFEEMESAGTGLVVWGGIGTGKTYLVACIANALIDKEIPVLMTSIPQISFSMSRQFQNDLNKYLDDLNNYRLLIVDDLGVERSTEFSLEQIYSFIDARYRSGKPMLFTTNLPLNMLEKPGDIGHARIYSRIMERCVPLKLDNYDLRKLKARQQFEEMKKILNE